MLLNIFIVLVFLSVVIELFSVGKLFKTKKQYLDEVGKTLLDLKTAEIYGVIYSAGIVVFMLEMIYWIIIGSVIGGIFVPLVAVMVLLSFHATKVAFDRVDEAKKGNIEPDARCFYIGKLAFIGSLALEIAFIIILIF